jgi:hypothetical protein
MKTNALSALALAFLATACASNKNKAEKMDTQLEKQQNVSGGTTVGLRDGNVVVQRKVKLAEELRKLEGEVFAAENELYGNEQYGTTGLQGHYKECLKKLADPRIGGSGKITPIASSAPVTENEQELKFAIDEKEELVGVSEEMLRDRIKRFQGYRSVLRERKGEISTNLELCENEHRNALINHGMNPEDTKSKGEWVMGKQGYKVWRAKKNATDDPEELSRRKAQRDARVVPPAEEDVVEQE